MERQTLNQDIRYYCWSSLLTARQCPYVSLNVAPLNSTREHLDQAIRNDRCNFDIRSEVVLLAYVK